RGIGFSLAFAFIGGKKITLGHRIKIDIRKELITPHGIEVFAGESFNVQAFRFAVSALGIVARCPHSGDSYSPRRRLSRARLRLPAQVKSFRSGEVAEDLAADSSFGEKRHAQLQHFGPDLVRYS